MRLLKANALYKTKRLKKGQKASKKHIAQRRLTHMKAALTFLNRDSSGRVTGINESNSANNDVSPLCPKCKSAMILRKPKKDQRWLMFWGCKQFKNGCSGTAKYKF